MSVLAAESAATGTTWLLPALLVLMLVGLFYMNSRTRKKMAAKQDAMRTGLRIGSRVQLISGLRGKVAYVDTDEVGIEIADGVVAAFNPKAVAEVLSTPDPFATPTVETVTVEQDLTDTPPAAAEDEAARGSSTDRPTDR